MKDNVLKKEFKKKDVERLRNLVKGKTGNKTGQSVGYKKDQTFHDEGDVWEESGRTWTIKDGIKQNITKLDKVKKKHITPLFCPSCSKQMKNKFDDDYYKIHKMCFNCVVDFEHNLKKSGLFEAYEKNIINSEIEGFIENFKVYVEEELNQSNNSFITEQGDVEKWDGGLNREKVLESLDKTIEHLRKMKK